MYINNAHGLLGAMMPVSRLLIVALVLFLKLADATAASKTVVPDVIHGLLAGAPTECGTDDFSDD